jgi:DNA (cytosine-5)-methyltransferase 1
VSVFGLNFPGVPIWHGDIADLSVQKALDMARVQPGELTVFDGSPPCQGFSTAGKRHLHDPRNQLFMEFVRLVDGLQPQAFVMENVRGMVIGKMRAVFNEAQAALEGCGYKVTAGIVNMALLGVPQARQRLIVLGVRNDLGIKPSLPKPVVERRTVDDAFRLLCKAGRPHSNLGLHTKKHTIMRQLAAGQSGSKVLEGKGLKGNFYGVGRLHQAKPAFTITSDNQPIGHPQMPRLCTDTELCRLCSFPDDYNWADSSVKQIRARIGNSVPPLGMFHIAKHISNLLGYTTET